MNACYWKGRRFDKKEKNFKRLKQKLKAQLANYQPITLLDTKPSNQNPRKIRGNCCNRQLGCIAIGISVISINLVNTIFNSNNSGSGQSRLLKDVSQVIY